jgi:cell division protein FtsZ
LLLDASRLVDEDAPLASGAIPGRRRGLVSDTSGVEPSEYGEAAGDGAGDGPSEAAGSGDEPAAASPVAEDRPAKPAPRVGGGATLFERMANLSRGGRTAADDDDEDAEESSSISIPRFLGRQNNQ